MEVVVPQRSASRRAPEIAAELREVVPPGETVRLFRLKDEGVMFYYGRPAKRERNRAFLPRPVYAFLIEAEWEARDVLGEVEMVHRACDQQGDPLIVVRIR